MKGAADTYEGRGLIADPIHQYILYTRPGGHFFDDNFLVAYHLTHELVGQRIIRDELADILRSLRRSPSGAFHADEAIDPEWICYLMGKGYTEPQPHHPTWLKFLKPLLS